MGGLKDRNLFSHNSGGWKSKVKLPVEVVSSEVYLLNLHTSALFLLFTSCPSAHTHTCCLLSSGQHPPSCHHAQLFQFKPSARLPLRLAHTFHHGMTELLPTPTPVCQFTSYLECKCLYKSQPKPREDLLCVTMCTRDRNREGRSHCP